MIRVIRNVLTGAIIAGIMRNVKNMDRNSVLNPKSGAKTGKICSIPSVPLYSGPEIYYFNTLNMIENINNANCLF